MTRMFVSRPAASRRASLQDSRRNLPDEWHHDVWYPTQRVDTVVRTPASSRQDFWVEQVHPLERAARGERDVLKRAHRHTAVGRDGIAADMRREDDVRQRAKVGPLTEWCVRFLCEHIQRGASQAMIRQRVEERRL